LNNSQQQKLLEENFASIGIGIIEAAMAWWMEPKKIQRLAHVEGVEHVQQALTKGSGVILLSAHQTALELCAPIIAPHLAVRCIYRPQKNRLFNFFMERARAR